MKRPTQKDVARRAGVSRSTVSYVLNDQKQLKVPISDETRQRVNLYGVVTQISLVLLFQQSKMRFSGK